MLPRYRQHVAQTSNLLPGNMLSPTYMLTATCCSFGQHVARAVNAALHLAWTKTGGSAKPIKQTSLNSR